MSDRTYNVLFLCTGNSARSILAEATLNNMTAQRTRFKAFSAGSAPKGEINPFTLELLSRFGIPTEGLRSKSWEEFATPDSPVMDFVITVCDQAAGEVCPVWPGQPIIAHWGVPDPAAVQGNDEQKRHAFFDACSTLKRRIDLFTSLPIQKLEGLALEERVKSIGKE